jgi:hypothetical protein
MDTLDLNGLLAGGGEVVVGRSANGTWLVRETVVLRPDTHLCFGAGVRLAWVGPAGAPFFASDGVDPLMRTSVIGHRARIDQGTAGVLFNLRSPQFCEFGGFQVDGGSPTSTTFRIRADTERASGFNGTRNAVKNVVRDVYQYGMCGTFLSLEGRGPDGVVTHNSFRDLWGNRVYKRFVSVVQWADTNTFGGNMVGRLTHSGAVGVVLNDSADPDREMGVYNISMDHVAIDAFAGKDQAGLPYTGRVGMQINNAKQISVGAFYQQPAAEGGDLVVSDLAHSFRVLMTSGAHGGMRAVARGVLED